MTAIRYKTCAVGGTRADAVLEYREQLSALTQSVYEQIANLNNIPVDRTNEPVVLSGQTPSVLQRNPSVRTIFNRDSMRNVESDNPIITSLPDQQGVQYRVQPRLNTKGGLMGGSLVTGPNGVPSLNGVVENAYAQWMFSETDLDSDFMDSSVYGRSALITGSAAFSSSGQLKTSRYFTPGVYGTVPTKQALVNISQSQLDFRNGMAAWAWAQAGSLGTERILCSFSSPETGKFAGTVTVTNGSKTVTGKNTGFKFYKINEAVTFDSQSGTVYRIETITNDELMTVTSVYTGTTTADTGIKQSPLTGTVAINNGSPSVTGTGTNFQDVLQAYDILVMPDGRLYRVLSITNNTAMTLDTNYLGSNVAGSSTFYRAEPFQPKNRNAIYGFSVNAAGNLRYWHQYGQRETYEFVSSFTVPVSQPFFASVQRQVVTLPGKVLSSGSSVTGDADTRFTELSVGWWVQIESVEGWHQIAAITDDQNMTVVGDLGPARWSRSRQAIRKAVAQLALGLQDGTFQHESDQGFPLPEGGIEPRPLLPGQYPNGNDSLADFYIARDEERPALGWLGYLDALSVFPANLDDLESSDPIEKLHFHYSRSFPDFVRTASNSIARSAVSDIPDGSTVYAFYRFVSGLNDANSIREETMNGSGSLLAAMGNPNANSMSSLAAATGNPNPDDMQAVSLAADLMSYGIVAVDGKVLIRGETDINNFLEFSRYVGGIQQAQQMISTKKLGSFFLISFVEERFERQSFDACGNLVPSVEIVERVVGVNKNLHEAALSAGFTNTDNIKFKIFWVGRTATDNGTVLLLSRLGLSNTEIVHATQNQSLAPRMISYIIGTGELSVLTVFNDGLLSYGDLPPINTNPSTADTALAIQTAMVANAGLTSDGNPRPDDPALLIGTVVDLAGLYSPRETLDQFVEQVGDQVDSDCATMATILDGTITSLTELINRMVPNIAPWTLQQRRSYGEQKEAMNIYIPCVASVSASINAPALQISLNKQIKLFDLARQVAEQTEKAVVSVVEKAREALCVPRALLSALRGGQCGIEQPKVIAERSCPSSLDVLLEKLQALLDSIDLLLRRVLLALSVINLDIEFSLGGASTLNAQFDIPCFGTVSKVLSVFG